MPHFHLLILAAFVAATAVLAWEPRPHWFLDTLRALNLRRITRLFLAAWVVLGCAFWWLFRGEQAIWHVLASLVEVAGVVYLAREVYMAQRLEIYRRKVAELQPFLELEPLADAGKLEAYLMKHYELSGVPRSKAELEISLLKSSGMLADFVNNLRADVRRAYERPEGPLADVTLEYRQKRLVRGIVLVVVGLGGHAALALLEHA